MTTMLASNTRLLAEIRVNPAGCPEAVAGAILHAYFQAEEARAFNRLLLRRLILVAVAWLAAGLGVLGFGWGTLLVGFGMLAAGGLCGVVGEYRAVKNLRALLATAR